MTRRQTQPLWRRVLAGILGVRLRPNPDTAPQPCLTPDPFAASRRPLCLTALTPDGVTTLPTGPLDPREQAELIALIARKRREEAAAETSDTDGN